MIHSLNVFLWLISRKINLLFQASDTHERLYASGGSSPPRWGSTAGGGGSSGGGGGGSAVSEKRQHSPLHHVAAGNSEYEDSLDGAPAAKRARAAVIATGNAVSSRHASGSGCASATGVKVRGISKNYASAAASSPSCSRMVAASQPLVEDDEEDMEEMEEGYNSEDEYSYSHVGVSLSEEEWAEKDRR